MKNLNVLRILNRFFKIAALLFLLLTFSFQVDSAGVLSILWRDQLPLALTFTGLAACMALGWVVTSRRLKSAAQTDDTSSLAQTRKRVTAPYNIFGVMEPSVRRRMAIAVFLTSATIGPLSFLMGSSLSLSHPLPLFIRTISCGGIGASFILFGHKKFWLVFFFLFFQFTNMTAYTIADMFVSMPTVHLKTSGDDILLTKNQIADIQAQRVLVGFGGILLLAAGYVMWLVVLNKEGSKRIRYQTEVQIAQTIQQRLLPSEVFRNRWCEASGLTVPATDVGGDYFDFITIDENRVAVVIADVAGHGIGAGILSAMTKSALHSQILHDPSPVAVLQNVNATLHQVAERKMFVTLAYALLDWNEKRARIATAGHPPVLHTGNGTMQEVRTQSLGLGMQRNGKFDEVVVPIAVGDSLCLYTDGVTETANEANEQFGIERLMKFVSTNGTLSADALAQNVLKEVKAFAKTNELKDDATIVCIRLNTSNL